MNTGSGNPGAIGIQFMANNQGGMENVLIENDDNQGVYGLDLGYSDEQGPCLIKGIEVVGFDIGIRTKHAVDGVVLTNITLRDQKKFGLHNDGQSLSIENMSSSGSVPALYNTGAGLVAVINSTFSGTGAASGVAAITNLNGLFARNIRTTGFLKAIDNRKGGKTTDATTIDEFVSHEVQQLFTSPKKSLNLPIKPTPEIPLDPLGEWVNVGSYPAQTMTLPSGKVVKDYTNALQKAIDAGKSTVYFGDGSGPFYGTVYVRGKVKRILGMEGWMGDDVRAHGTLVIEDGSSPVVLIEKFSNDYNKFELIHNAARSAVVKNMMLDAVTIKPGAGDLFLEDVVAGGIVNIAAGANLYARQLNAESLDNPKIRNFGNLWVLGIKTERDAAAVGSYKGSRTEIVGGFIYANKSTDPDKVMFVNEDGSQFSATVGEWVIRNQPFNPVRETRDGVTLTLKRGEAPGRGQGTMLPLYTGYRSLADAPPAGFPTGLRASSPRYDVIEIYWTDNSNNEDGFIIDRKISDGTFMPYAAAHANQTIFRDTLLAPSTAHAYRVRAVNAAGQSAWSDSVSVTTLDAPATPTIPGDLVATVKDANVLVTWRDNSLEETGFKLERRTIQGNVTTAFAQIALLGPNITSYYEVGLAGNASYEYRVQSYQEVSHSEYSNVASAKLGAATELLVHWKMDEISGAIAGDASGHANNGRLKGGSSFGTQAVAGRLGQALQLAGSGDYVSGTNNGRYLSSENYPFTMSTWFKTSDDGVLLHFGDKDRADMYFTLSITPNGEAKLEASYGGTVRNVIGPQVKDDSWHLMTGVFERSDTHKLYVDGALRGTLGGSIPAHRYLTRFTAGAKEAAGSSTSRLRAVIDDVRLYDRALSEAEVMALFKAEGND